MKKSAMELKSGLRRTVTAIKRKLAELRRAGTINGEIRIKVRAGRLGKVFTDVTDEKMRRSARVHQFWKQGKGKATSPPQPLTLAERLGAVDAAPPQPLTRAGIYGMDED
jgi:hypothetical protein